MKIFLILGPLSRHLLRLAKLILEFHYFPTSILRLICLLFSVYELYYIIYELYNIKFSYNLHRSRDHNSEFLILLKNWCCTISQSILWEIRNWLHYHLILFLQILIIFGCRIERNTFSWDRPRIWSRWIRCSRTKGWANCRVSAGDF